MLKRFMETDRVFAKARRCAQPTAQGTTALSASGSVPDLETA
jgi:hypothetical protein